jgi:hypothetical protein
MYPNSPQSQDDSTFYANYMYKTRCLFARSYYQVVRFPQISVRSQKINPEDKISKKQISNSVFVALKNALNTSVYTDCIMHNVKPKTTSLICSIVCEQILPTVLDYVLSKNLKTNLNISSTILQSIQHALKNKIHEIPILNQKQKTYDNSILPCNCKNIIENNQQYESILNENDKKHSCDCNNECINCALLNYFETLIREHTINPDFGLTNDNINNDPLKSQNIEFHTESFFNFSKCYSCNGKKCIFCMLDIDNIVLLTNGFLSYLSPYSKDTNIILPSSSPSISSLSSTINHQPSNEIQFEMVSSNNTNTNLTVAQYMENNATNEQQQQQIIQPTVLYINTDEYQQLKNNECELIYYKSGFQSFSEENITLKNNQAYLQSLLKSKEEELQQFQIKINELNEKIQQSNMESLRLANEQARSQSLLISAISKLSGSNNNNNNNNNTYSNKKNRTYTNQQTVSSPPINLETSFHMNNAIAIDNSAEGIPTFAFISNMEHTNEGQQLLEGLCNLEENTNEYNSDENDENNDNINNNNNNKQKSKKSTRPYHLRVQKKCKICFMDRHNSQNCVHNPLNNDPNKIYPGVKGQILTEEGKKKIAEILRKKGLSDKLEVEQTKKRRLNSP